MNDDKKDNSPVIKTASEGFDTCLYANSNELNCIRFFTTFAASPDYLKKPSGGPKGLIGPPCHGAPGPLQKIFIKGGHDLLPARIYANRDRLWLWIECMGISCVIKFK
jgi:hypothetical protein